MPNKISYLDNAATTKASHEVINTFNRINESYFANPSSIHFLGQEAHHLLEEARKQILHVLKMDGHELIFTSGATEANNLALKGYALKYANRGKHIISSLVEHPSVLETLKQLEEQFGFEITYLPVNEYGAINLDELKAAIRKDTILVSIMAVNNETGAINPIEAIGALLKNYPLIGFHVDATQAIGKISFDYSLVDFLTFSGHKIHGLKGSGALIKKKGIDLLPIATGGGQENNLRSGTNDLANACCLAKAIRIAYEKIDNNFAYVSKLQKMLLDYLKANSDRYVLNSNPNNPYIVNFSLLTKKASVVVEALSNKGIMVSSTSACHARGEAMSYVVYASKNDEHLAHNTIRVSFSYENNLNDISNLTDNLHQIVEEIK